MSLITRKQFQALIANGRKAVQARRVGRTFDPYPVVKLLSQDEHPLWLLSEIDPTDRDRAYGICDLGTDVPDLRHVSLAAVEGLRDLIGIDVRQEADFVADRPLSEYFDSLRVHGRII